MKSPSCRAVPPLFLSLCALGALAGCAGHNGLSFPWATSEDSKLEHVTSVNFDQRVLQSDKPVLVDFYAPWCHACNQLSPVVEEFAAEHPEYRVVKVNVDENRALAQRYSVAQMPTLLVVRGGSLAGRSVGCVPKKQLVDLMHGPASPVNPSAESPAVEAQSENRGTRSM